MGSSLKLKYIRPVLYLASAAIIAACTSPSATPSNATQTPSRTPAITETARATPTPTLEAIVAEPTGQPTHTPEPTPENTPTPYILESTAIPTSPPPTATSVPPTPTPMPPNFIFEDSPVKYEGRNVISNVNNTGGLGTLVARLYDPNNPKNSFPVQEHEFAAGVNHTFNFDVSQLERGVDYNLKLDLIDKTSGETKIFGVPGFYVPRAAVLELNADKANYKRDEKRLIIPIKNLNPDQRDKSAENVTIELFYQGKPIGTANRVSIKPGSIENLVADGISLNGGPKDITAKLTYNNGFETKTHSTKPFIIEVPYLPANLAFTNIPGSNDKIAISLDGSIVNLKSALRADLLYTFKVNLTNNGEIKSDRTTIELYKDSIASSNFLKSVPVSNIEPGNPHEVGGKFKINATGVHKIYAVIPPYNLTLETTVTGETAPIEVTAPHSSFGFDSFYKKYFDASGIPIIGSDKVQDAAFYAARDVVNGMLSTRPDIRATLIAYNLRVAIIAETEVITDIPEHSNLYKRFPGVDWNTRARGYGGTWDIPVTVTAEENLLCKVNDKWRGDSNLVHEFGHTIMDLGLLYSKEMSSIVTDIINSYNNALEQGKWKNTYAGTNDGEYWADGIGAWFNAQRDNISGLRNHVNTREELKAYDSQLTSILSNVFRDNEWRYSCPTNTR